MPFTLDDLLKLHPHEVVNLINRYREGLEVFRDAVGMTDDTRRELAARYLNAK